MGKTQLELFSENTEKKIRNHIKEVEKGTSRRRLVPEHLDEIIKAIKETRAGVAHACGGSIVKVQQYPAKTTYFIAVWYTLRKKKFVKYDAAKVKYPPFYEDKGTYFKQVITPLEAYMAVTGKPILGGGYKTPEEIANELLVSALSK